MASDTTNYGHVANIVTSFIEIPSKICLSVYFSGCVFNCIGCQNPELQDLNYGKKMHIGDVLNVINKNKLARWVCFLGGEPFFQYDFLLNLCKNINKSIGIYTGNSIDTIFEKYPEILSLDNVKFIKTGKYIELLKCNNEFPITSNQMVYVKKNNDWVLCHSRNINEISIELENIN